MEKEFYTPQEAALRLSVNTETILRLIRNNKITASNVGTGKRVIYRIATRDLNSFINVARNDTEQPGQHPEN